MRCLIFRSYLAIFRLLQISRLSLDVSVTLLAMRSLLIILLIPLLLIGPFAVSAGISMAGATAATSPGETPETAEATLSLLQRILDVIASAWLAAGLVTAYIVFRSTFGRQVCATTGFLKFCLFSLFPTIGFALSFFVTPPHAVITLLGEAVGSLASYLLAATAFIFGIGVHGITTTAVRLPDRIDD